MADAPIDEKYTVFKTEELFQMLGRFLPKGNVDCAPVAQEMKEAVEEVRLKDTVVIRRQDHFAPGALHVYAANVGMMIRSIKDLAGQVGGVAGESLRKQARSLQRIADYFNEQAVASEAEAWKLPD